MADSVNETDKFGFFGNWLFDHGGPFSGVAPLVTPTKDGSTKPAAADSVPATPVQRAKRKTIFDDEPETGSVKRPVITGY